jgi:ABC-2 type transport system ATP-binding protein
MPAAIQCRDLRKTYDDKVEAVRGLNLEIQPGECFGLLGPKRGGEDHDHRNSRGPI